ncbi:MAG: hypothetical protein PHD88_05430 [Firmicutes bacterium]|nr:hypothetical protein [Bacillota bacterium]MDD4263851.1 hypothetical protein [Bacillota bacterium]MDD4693822.1 hypothetical protein [Bacillota bacterium]
MKTKEIYLKARNFVYRNARPLDLALWKYHFEAGGSDAVVEALSHYQNLDGGFGHALEPDCWNPNSSPIQTWAATEILRDINFNDKSHQVIQGILQYLESGVDFNQQVWLNAVPSNNNYPCAPWWSFGSDSTSHTDYNPTAALAGFALLYADKNKTLYRTATRVAKKAVDWYLVQDSLNDMHTAACYIQLLEYCEAANNHDLFDLHLLKTKLITQVKNCITRNTADWETSYICKPSQFFSSPDSIFYPGNEDIADFECNYIKRTQLEDGSWNIPWSWSDYPNEWAISKNWWKSTGIIINLLYLRGFGRL